ncbi:uncharacterized protein LOC111055042 [Nilaparvata lugens]|uniref:uncharacterized protein LOC111055042 n=1 Tax=Nilaparvata lugens TaxID=108931 RepID=UPI000B9947A0|nr:uncharacterized protein LOC111055042 [Nilaparvata lugens]
MFAARVFFVLFCAASLIGCLEAVGRSNSNTLSRSATQKQVKSVYNGLDVANGGGVPQAGASRPVSTTSDSSSESDRSFRSAWGIITLIIVIVAGGATGYYVTLFYPLICKKQGKYDIMEHSPV